MISMNFPSRGDRESVTTTLPVIPLSSKVTESSSRRLCPNAEGVKIIVARMAPEVLKLIDGLD